MTIKVAFLQNIVVPYEIPLFQALSSHPGIQLKVFFCARTYKERRWKVPTPSGFDHELLKGVTVEIDGATTSFNPSIVIRLIAYRPDVLVISGGYNNITMQLAFLIARILELPVVYRSDQNRVVASARGRFAKLARPIERAMIRVSSALVCPGTSSVQYHSEEGASPGKIFIAPYTTEDDDAYVAESSRLRGRKEELKSHFGIVERQVVLFAGRLEEEKGIRHLVDAFRTLRSERQDVALVLVGTGSLLPFYQAYCNLHGVAGVYFPGFVSSHDKLAYFSIADVFVLPSISDPWGLVVNEAMLCSLPVVVSASAGSSEMVVPNKTGHVVRPANSEDICDRTRLLLDNDGLRLAIGAQGQVAVRTGYNILRRTQGVVAAIKFAMSNQRGRT